MCEEKLNKTLIKWRGNASWWRWYACENNGRKKDGEHLEVIFGLVESPGCPGVSSAVLNEMEETEAGIATAKTIWFCTLSHANLRSYTNKEKCFS